MSQQALGVVAAGMLLLSAGAAGSAEPTRGLPATLRVLVAADEMPEMRVAFRDADVLLAGLREGEVDAVVMALFDYALASKRDHDLVAGAFVGARTSAALAVRPGDGPLLEALDGYLDGMRHARHALMFKYLSEEALSLIALARRD
jgi:hypothetical protein